MQVSPGGLSRSGDLWQSMAVLEFRATPRERERAAESGGEDIQGGPDLDPDSRDRGQVHSVALGALAVPEAAPDHQVPRVLLSRQPRVHRPGAV